MGPTTRSCGGSLCDSGSSTTTPPATTTSPSSTAGQWVPATTNLTGLASECGNMSLVSARQGPGHAHRRHRSAGSLGDQHDGSTTWRLLSGHGPGSATIINRPSSITYDPSHPNTFWESGIYNGGGAYETPDNGTTFKQLGDLTHSDSVSVDLSDPARRTLLSGRHEASNLYRSADGGATWVDLSSKLPSSVGYTSWPLIINSQVHLLGTTAGAASGVFRTVDGGATWSRVYQGAVSGPPLVAKSDGAIYWLLDRGGGMIKSTDQGTTWQVVTRTGPISSSASSLIELPTDSSPHTAHPSSCRRTTASPGNPSAHLCLTRRQEWCTPLPQGVLCLVRLQLRPRHSPSRPTRSSVSISTTRRRHSPAAGWTHSATIAGCEGRWFGKLDVSAHRAPLVRHRAAVLAVPALLVCRRLSVRGTSE